MDEEKLIQVSFQIPPSALDSLSRLAEQLRMLTETVAAQTVSAPRTAESERGESASFDHERFLAMQQGADILPQAVRADISNLEDAKTVSTAISHVEDAETASATVSQVGDAETASATVSQVGDAETASATVSHVEDAEAASAAISQVEDAETVTTAISQTGDAEAVSAEVQKSLQEAESAGDVFYHHLADAAAADTANALPHTPLEERDIPLPPAEAVQASQLDNIPAVRAETEVAVPDAPEAGRDVEQQVPDVESTRADAEKRELALATAQGEVSGGVEAPLGAGVVIQTQPEMPQSRWSSVTEELVIPGPAPLTAEAVSLAFERDGRRYDNGFPLY